jgi:hypothetical protein
LADLRQAGLERLRQGHPAGLREGVRGGAEETLSTSQANQCHTDLFALPPRVASAMRLNSRAPEQPWYVPISSLEIKHETPIVEPSEASFPHTEGEHSMLREAQQVRSHALPAECALFLCSPPSN